MSFADDTTVDTTVFLADSEPNRLFEETIYAVG